jgi:hypothetical protein
MTHSDEVFRAAERASLQPPDDEPDPLEGVSMGVCPVCRQPLVENNVCEDDECTYEVFMGMVCWCDWWDWDLSEDENRARYVAERLEQARVDEQVNRSLRRSGGEEL